MKPQEPIPHNYSMLTLHKIFAVSSLLLLLATAIVVVYDYWRGWKGVQLRFLALQEQRIKADLKQARAAQDKGELKRLQQELDKSGVEIARDRERYRLAAADARKWEGEHYRADQDYRFTKAVLDAIRYEVELARTKKLKSYREKEQEYRKQSDKVQALKIELEKVTRSRDLSNERLKEWLGKIDRVEARRKEIDADVSRLSKQLATVEKSAPNIFLNLPLLDFVNPTLKVDQVVLPDLFVDMNYLRVPRVDRCMTCHRAIDRVGFESKKEAKRLQAELEGKLEGFQFPHDKVADVESRIEQLKRIQSARKGIPNPFRTHPNLDTFVGSASPHPLTDFGCTVCHRGLDRATDFARAGHSPKDHKQQHRWEHNLGWKPQPYLETPMHPRQYVEGSCIKCHGGQTNIKSGPSITRGVQMVELYGCHACHKISNWRFANLRKPGPDLTGIAEKTSPQWTARWISEPHQFRSTTRMPSFFYQRNMVGPAVSKTEKEGNVAKQNVEIQAIVSYLFASSTRRQWQGGGAGDPGRGKQIVESVGCMGCHISGETFTEPDGKVRKAKRDDFPLERNYGFNLTGTGTKSNPAWLFNWLKNPKRYYEDAPMPDLRLTDQEASDVTSYLMTLQKPEFMQKPLPPINVKAMQELTRSYLISTMSELEAEAKVRAMPVNDQLVFLGQRTIEKYGCYSCHTIKGFENAKPIGTELTIEGSKTLHLFDFGFVHEYKAHDGVKEHIEHTVPSWIYSKVRSPRVWDDKREKVYQDKLKMPNFYLSKEEADSVTAVIMGLTKDRVAQNRVASQDPRQRVAEEGRKAIAQRNCRACHRIDGEGRAIAATIADSGQLPPDITPTGERVQSDWLFNFLKDPTIMTMRPWLTVRMPTFHFSDEETNTIVAGFAAEGKVPQFDTTRTKGLNARNVAVGQAVFAMLRCAQCHPSGGAAVSVQNTASLAPSLALARTRLRHDWIPDWIRRPNEIIPGTQMPTNFPRNAETGGFISPLDAAIDTPGFAASKAALMRHFASEEELRRTMGDPVALSNYLRDYIWSIGPSQLRTAAPAPDGFVAPVPAVKPSSPPPPARSTSAAPVAARAGG